jgi:hypothetical protein
LLSIAASTMLLTGCATVRSSGCPPLVTYPKQFQARAANAVKGLDAEERETVGVLVKDYGQLRDGCRAIGSTK